MTKYYANKYKEGVKYQNFIKEAMKKALGIELEFFIGKKNQLKGETKQGIEVKYQKPLKETRNLYIELEEKSNPRNPHYVKSGIFREDNTTQWITGDYDHVYLINKSDLIELCKTGRYSIIENDMKTSRGFLLPMHVAERICLRSWHD